MKWIFIFCVIIISCNQSNPNGRLSKAELDSFVWRMNNKFNYELYEQPTLEPMKNYLVHLEDSVKKLNYDKLTLYWTLYKAQYFFMQQKYDTIHVMMKDAVRLSKSKDISKKDLLYFYMVYDGILKNQGLIDSALKIANEAYFLAREIDTNRLTQTSLDLARIYQKLDDLSNFRKYIFEAWKHSNTEPELKTFITSGISYYYDRTNKIDSALYFIRQSEKDSFMVMKPQDKADNYLNEAEFLIKKGSIEQGFNLQLRAKSIYDSLGLTDATTYYNLSQTYGTLKQFNRAIEYVDSSKLLAEQSNDYNMIRVCWYNKAAIYAKIPDYKKANEALDSAYQRYSIEINSSLREQARELETKYAVREKDNQINTLALTNQANLKIRNQQKLIIITMTIVIVLLGVIGFLIWRRRQTQMQLRETNLRQQLLRTQMEPHFLFNALSVLKSLIRNEGVEKSANYLSNLATLVRFNLENARESLVLFQNEIKALESYLQLQAMYHPGLFEYRIEIYDDYEQDDIFIPPMLLQPFVENAISHGFMGIDYKGLVVIKIAKKHSTLDCIIEDNGKGLQPAAEKKPSLSTIINEERLSILSRQLRVPAKLMITEKQKENLGSGVRVEILIPFRGTAA